jgi:hypothetical protein
MKLKVSAITIDELFYVFIEADLVSFAQLIPEPG